MNNDLIIQERETKKQLVQIINESRLPAFVLQYMFKEIYDELCNLSQKEYAKALCLEKEKNKKEEEE